MGDADSVQIVKIIEERRDLSYPIIHGIGLFPRVAKEMKELAEKKGGNPGFAIITDTHVAKLYGKPLEDRLKATGLKADMFVFEAGEENKNIYTYADLVARMLANNYDRSSVIIALGGGVVGDMAGFIAGTYMRGADLVQFGTSLLAQADSSIGGKTALNIGSVKNAVGVFYQPKLVVIDVATLRSLPERELKSGLAETIKHGVLGDAQFFEYLEQNMDRILARSEEHLLYVSKQNCRIKAEIVEKDPNEKGVRRTLNYGHTIGHAVESLSGYQLTHGESVSIGMNPATELAVEICGFPRHDAKRLKELSKRAGLPVTMPFDMPFEEIIRITASDKKAKDGNARYTLPEGMGQMANFGGEYATYVKPELIMRALQASR